MARTRRRAIMVAAPLVSIATLMIGLRVGARGAVRAAAVYVAPPGKALGAGTAPLALQIVTYAEDRGVRETVAIDGLTVVARAGGREAQWSGSSNADGVAEASLVLSELGGDSVEVEVRAPGEELPLASGVVTWEPRAAGAGTDDDRDPEASVERAAVRPSLREGEIALDVLVEGGRLVVGETTSIWVRAEREGLDGSTVTLVAKPEPGLRLEDEAPIPSCDGWTELRAVAEAHVVGLAVEATDAAGRSGRWFGALPVAPGAFGIRAPRILPAYTESSALVVAPSPRSIAYAEVNDERGRVFAAALPLEGGGDDPLPRARLALPPLAPGVHWLVVSGEPRGAERVEGATLAKPFLVGATPGVDPERECSLGPWLARHPRSAFPRRLALDGMAARSAPNQARHRVGLLLGVGSLLAAAALEVLLLTRAAREARDELRVVEARAGGAQLAEGGASLARFAVGLLVATLGLLLLAALVVAES